MWIVDGAVTMTIGDETRHLVADDVVVVNPGIEHELVSESGVTFVEALTPGFPRLVADLLALQRRVR